MNQQDFENVLISQLSGIAEMKNEREVWWQDGWDGHKVTVELADRTISGKVIVREYWKNGNIRYEEVYPSGLQNNSEALAFYRDGSKYYKRMRVNGVNQYNGSEDYKCATSVERQYVKAQHLDTLRGVLDDMMIASRKLLNNSQPQKDTDLEYGSRTMSLALDLRGCLQELGDGDDQRQEEDNQKAIENQELVKMTEIVVNLYLFGFDESFYHDINEEEHNQIESLTNRMVDTVKDMLKSHPENKLQLPHY